jgi:hypothetical protein
MSPTPKKRPSHTRKVTKATEKKRIEGLDEGVTLTVDGKSYTVRAGDLTGLDVAALRREVGMSFAGIMTAMGRDPDVDLVAALIWLSRRIDGETTLAFDEVAADIGYDLELEVAQAEPEGDSEKA